MLLLLIFLVFYWEIITCKCTFIIYWDYNALVEWFISSLHGIPSTQKNFFHEFSGIVFGVNRLDGQMWVWIHWHFLRSAKYHLQIKLFSKNILSLISCMIFLVSREIGDQDSFNSQPLLLSLKNYYQFSFLPNYFFTFR